MLIDSQSVINTAQEFPGIKVIQPEDLTLLGAPLLPCANEKVLSEKLDNLKTLTDHLKLLHEHDALYLSCFQTIGTKVHVSQSLLVAHSQVLGLS